jgi:hypothetical protein
MVLVTRRLTLTTMLVAAVLLGARANAQQVFATLNVDRIEWAPNERICGWYLDVNGAAIVSIRTHALGRRTFNRAMPTNDSLVPT